MILKKYIPFWLLTVSILVSLILPVLIQDGMFMDGLLYACVSKNLSHGLGTFWFPHYSKVYFTFFNHQPPLGFWIQSVFFKLLGDSIYIERFYSFLTALITAYLIAILWKLIFRNENEIKKLGWLPVFYWIIIPVCFWAYSNNMLENTMGIFDLLAIICIVRYLQSSVFYFILLSGVFIFAASMVKGFQGLFPLVAVFFNWFIYRNIPFKKMLFVSLIVFLIPAFIYFLLLQDDSVYESLSTYLNVRVLNSIQNVIAVENRFYMVGRLFSELLPVILISGILFVLTRRKCKKENRCIPFFKRHSLFFLLIGISASFPLMVTREQRGFYLVTSLPYYAICFAIIAAPYISFYIEKINTQRISFKVFHIISVLLLIGSFIFSFLQIGKTSRDKEALHDVYLIGKEVPENTVMGSPVSLWSDWALQEYFVRHYYICMDSKITSENEYIIVEHPDSIPPSIKTEKVKLPTIKYHLYKVIK